MDRIKKVRQRFFPYEISEDIECIPAGRVEMMTFLKRHFRTVFSEKRLSQHYLPPKSRSGSLAKLQRVYEVLHHEYFLFKAKGKIVGWRCGEMEDFETFYMRNTGLLPGYRDMGIYTSFLDQFLEYLEFIGYERVSSHHQPHNSGIISLKIKKGFVIVGSENHERWGQLVKMVKFFDPRREKFFKAKFL